MTTEPNATPSAAEQITERPAALPVAASPGAESTAPTLPAPPTITATPISTPKATDHGLKVDVVLLGLLLVLSFLLASFAATNSDLWMNLAIGKRLSEGQFEFGVDPFSWATEATEAQPAPYWVHHGWLTSWLFYQLYSLAGGMGLVIAKAILFTLAIALLSRIGWTQASRWFVVICLAMAALAISPRLLVQPMVISFLFLAGTMFVLDRAGMFASTGGESKPCCPRCLWALPPLFALWANLDQWFILGPLLVGLCWAGQGLGQWFGRPRLVPGKTLGLVFGIGLAACLINPHLWRIFQLPPELGYLLLSLHLPLPNEMVAGGRTLQLLRQANPTDGLSLWTISTASPLYFRERAFGLNVAGIAVYPLFLLGAGAFTLTAMVKPQPGAPVLHYARFLPWLLFVIMATALYRLIPFFAIVAAPLTALTLGEFLQWQQLQTGISAERRDRGLRLARLISVPFMLLLLFLAWPGWLHGINEFNSPRHVDWEVRPDRSLVQAAKTLQDLKKKEECRNVFNVKADLPEYCAWFAPEVKCGLDSRLALFVQQAPSYLKARQALRDPRRPAADWQKWFVERKVDQVVLANFMTTGELLYWWLNADHWRQRYGDSKTLVFSWSRLNRRWPVNSTVNDWDRQAFGDVPAEERPPLEGTMPPEPLPIWDLYLHGIGPTPSGVAQYHYLRLYYPVPNTFWLVALRPSLRFMCASLASVQALPGGGMSMAPAVVPLLHECNVAGIREPRKKEAEPTDKERDAVDWTMIRPLDMGPPALPILMVRAARRAVAKNPRDVLSQSALLEAYETLGTRQENFWVNPQGGFQAPTLRTRIRQTQKICSIHTLAQLQPYNFNYQEFLAKYYEQNLMIDLALDHWHMAEKALESVRSDNQDSPAKAKGFDNAFKQFQDMVKGKEQNVKLHMAKLIELSAGKKELELAFLAQHGLYQEMDAENVRVKKLGLGKKAVEILQSMKPANPQEEMVRTQMILELSLNMGRVDYVAEHLRREDIRKSLAPAILANFQAIVGGVLGDYDTMQKGLLQLEEMTRKGAEMQHNYWIASLVIPPGMHSSNVLASSMTWNAAQSHRFVADAYNNYFNTMTLRGIASLEAGDTKSARDIFHAAVDQVGEVHPFAERPLAKRYLDLLNAQHPH